MNEEINRYLSTLEVGELQQFNRMAVLPVFVPDNGGPTYLTLQQALENELLTVTEVDERGSVPEIKAVNQAESPVLLLDGEELAGAKQNRVLNTTVLLKARSETVIPVTCTEQGRWSYVSARFGDSNVLMAHVLRGEQRRTVTRSLGVRREYSSDQEVIWNSIADYADRLSAHSATMAMKSVVESCEHELKQYLSAFPCLPRQKGLLVFANGEIAGLDTISLESAYQILHPKLVRSYAIDAILEKTSQGVAPSVEKAEMFLKQAAALTTKRYEPVGHGSDYRFEGDTLLGSALVHENTVIHMAIFQDRSRGAGKHHL